MATTTTKIIPILDNWEDEDADWELAIKSLVVPQAETVEEIKPLVIATLVETKIDALVEASKLKNPYSIYPYFMASVEGTVLRELFPKSQYPIADLKHLVSTPEGLCCYVQCVRNRYIKPLFYILKSTKYFNPLTKTRVPPKKGERVDPGLAHVTIEDQKKVYNLFGFQGHVGSKKIDEDVKRDELLDKLKSILYDTPRLTQFIQLMLYRKDIHVEAISVRQSCEQIKTCEDYGYKSYSLSGRWYHDASWQKLRYVYGCSSLDKLGGGDGGIPHEVTVCMQKQGSYQK